MKERSALLDGGFSAASAPLAAEFASSQKEDQRATEWGSPVPFAAWPGDREGGACFWMGLMCTCGHRLWAGPEEVSVWRRGEGQTGAHYWTGDSLRISPPTSCLTRRQMRKGALLNGNPVRLSQPTSHLARRRKKGALLDWVFSASLAADFAPGPEAEEKGFAIGWGLCTPLAADFAPGPKVGAGAHYWMGLLCAFHRHLWAWPGGGTLLHEGFSSPFATDFSRPDPEVQVGGALIEGGFSAPFGADFGSPWDLRGDRT